MNEITACYLIVDTLSEDLIRIILTFYFYCTCVNMSTSEDEQVGTAKTQGLFAFHLSENISFMELLGVNSLKGGNNVRSYFTVCRYGSLMVGFYRLEKINDKSNVV